MAHLAKHELKPDHLKKLYTQLSKTIARCTKRETDVMLGDLLGKEEKIMLAKRFAAIVMLAEGNSTYRTAQLLHMSPSTTERLKKKLHSGNYQHLMSLVRKSAKEYEQFWNTLEVILRAGMPPMGKGRWKSVYTTLSPKK